MVVGETPLEMERRHVQEGEQRVADLELIATRWQQRGYVALENRTREILVVMWASLQLSRNEVQRLERVERDRLFFFKGK